MAKLIKKYVLSRVNEMHLKKYSDCLVGKQSKVVFKSFSPSRMKNVLDLVHSYLCRPFLKPLGSAPYFVTFINDNSRKMGHTL